MRIARATATGVLLLSVLALGGCKKKKPAVPQPQSQAPTITQPQPEPQPLPTPAATEPNRPQPEQPETATAPPPAAPAKPKPKPRPPVTAKKTPPPSAPAEKPPKTVVSDGGTQPATPQLSPSIPRDQAIHQKLNTSQLLDATDYNLKSVSRALSTEEQAMVQHIRSYMQQARDASKEGDTERAYNLAMKAHLLSDELVKR